MAASVCEAPRAEATQSRSTEPLRAPGPRQLGASVGGEEVKGNLTSSGAKSRKEVPRARGAAEVCAVTGVGSLRVPEGPADTSESGQGRSRAGTQRPGGHR